MSATKLYDALIQPLRLLDEQEGGLLRRLLERPQYHVDATRDRILSLGATDNPATCPGDLLQYLKDHVGFGAGSGEAFSGLGESSLRRLIGLAINFWNEKGTGRGIVAMARSLTGRDPVFDDWFDQRVTVGSSRVGESASLRSESLQEGPYRSTLKVMDDGSLDTAVLLELVNLLRPVGETIDISVLDFLDTFSGPLDRWEQTSGALPAIVANGALAFPQGQLTTMRPMVTAVTPADMSNVHLSCRFKLGSPKDQVRLFFYDATRQGIAGTHFLLLIRSNIQSMLLLAMSAGVPVYSHFAIDVGGGIVIEPNVFYRCNVEITNAPLAFFNIYINDVLQYRSPAGGEPVPTLLNGDVMIAAIGPGSVSVDSVEIWRSPLRWASVGPNGTMVSDTF